MHPDQFMIYHLTHWDSEKNKWNKKPVSLTGAPLPEGQGIPTTADRAAVIDTVNALNAGISPARYYMGLWLHADSSFFFLDLDDNAVDPTTQCLTRFANSLAAPFIAAGCYFEASTSGRGAHIIGRYHGVLPPHSTSRKRVHPHEFFIRDRGVVLNPSAHSGSWDIDATALLPALLTEHFPPRHVGEQDLFDFHDGPRDGWRGPVDDDELIRKFLGATGSQAARLRGSISLTDLWNGRCAHTSESDLALASHLAFWTGADAARIERLMRRSPLAPHRVDKWDTHRTYLRELTIKEACITTRTVYHEPERVDTATRLLGAPLRPLTPPKPVTTEIVETVTGGPLSLIGAPLGVTEERTAADWYEAIEQALGWINTAGNYKELMSEVAPRIAAMAFPKMHREALVRPFEKKTDMMGAKQSLGDIRALLAPPVLADALQPQIVPDWAAPIVFVLSTDSYFDTSTATEYSGAGLRAEFSKHMPMKQTGVREDVVHALNDKWNLQTVQSVEYRPDMPPLFEFEGRRYANEFLHSSMPAPVIGSTECARCIELFKQHLLSFVNYRATLYTAILGWIAHNVQYPGVKIRWSPLLQGPGGDGKSIFNTLFRSVMGSANVKTTSPSTLDNSGGFTDWAVGVAVNIIEEMRLDPAKARHLYNTLKNYIGDDTANVNRKGKASGRDIKNVTNHLVLTNYRNAAPIEEGDRRYGIVFSPWTSADEAAKMKGLASAADLPGFFGPLADSMRGEPGAWRAWLMGIDLSSFDPNSRAPQTEELQAMKNNSGDFVEQTIRDAITQGGGGISVEAFSSRLLMKRTHLLMDERPDTRAWNRILSNLGYFQQDEQIWWNSQSHRVWVKKPLTKAEILEIFNRTVLSTPQQ